MILITYVRHRSCCPPHYRDERSTSSYLSHLRSRGRILSFVLLVQCLTEGLAYRFNSSKYYSRCPTSSVTNPKTGPTIISSRDPNLLVPITHRICTRGSIVDPAALGWVICTCVVCHHPTTIGKNRVGSTKNPRDKQVGADRCPSIQAATRQMNGRSIIYHLSRSRLRTI